MKNISKNLVLIATALIPCYIFRFNILGLPTNTFEILVVLAFLATLFSRRSQKEKSVSWSDLLPAILFLIAALISVGISHFNMAALGILKGWVLIPIIFAWTVIRNFDSKSIKKLFLALYVPLIVVSILAILQKLGIVSTLFYQVGDQSFSQYLSEGRVFGIFESPNFLAMFIVPLFFLSFPGIIAMKEVAYKYICYVLYIFPLLVLCLTGSRAGMIALVASILFFFLLYKKKRKLTDADSSLSTIAVSFFAILNIIYLFFSVYGYQATRGGDLVRIEIYKYSLQMLRADWLFGIGLGTFYDKITALSVGNSSFQSNGLSYALHPHNLFMGIWLSIGLLGMLAFFYLLYLIISKLMQKITVTSSLVFAALVAILIHGLFDTTYFKNDLSAIFWLIFAISVIIKRDEQKASNN